MKKKKLTRESEDLKGARARATPDSQGFFTLIIWLAEAVFTPTDISPSLRVNVTFCTIKRYFVCNIFFVDGRNKIFGVVFNINKILLYIIFSALLYTYFKLLLNIVS